MNRAAWWIAFVSFALAVSAVWGVAVLRDRSATLAEATARLEATAALLEQHADRAMAAADRVLLSTQEAVRDHDLGDPALLRRLHELATRFVAGSPQLSSVWILDAAGTVVAENWDHPPRSRGDFSGRAYFREARDAPDDLIVGPLGIGATTARARFTISRALVDGEGRFAGVVVASVLSEYFAEVYGRAGLPPGARLVLALRDGRTLAQWPPDAPDPPGDLAVRRDLDRYPVRLEVSARSDGLLAAWETRAVWGAGGVLVAIAAFGGLCALGHRGTRREERAAAGLAAANRGLEARVAERTAALAAGEAELRALYDTAPIGMCVLDRELRYLRINRRLAEINGLPPEAHLGRTVREVVPDIAGAVEAMARKLFETGEPLFNFEITGETPAHPGVVRSWDESWVPLRGPDGSITGISIVAEETTERKRAEAEIHGLLAETRRLSDHKAAVAREMGHRIGNSFQMMEALLTLQSRGAADGSQRAALAVATGRVRAMAMVQRRLFESAEDEATRVDLGQYLRRLAPELERAFLPAGRCTLRVSAEPGLLATASDASAAAMFVAECVINASKYAFPGEARGTIAVTLAREGERWFLEVADNGLGLPEGFEPGASTGLGMRIVTAMARKLGGEAEVLREEPGTRFRVSLRGGS